MKIFRLYRIDNVDWDEYDSFVVAAKNPREAKDLIEKKYHKGTYSTAWTDKKNVKHRQVGVTFRKRPGIILGSFNAG